MLTTSNLTLAAGLALLGVTNSIPVLVVAWLLLGIGMGCGLYDAAFAALGRIYGDAARRSITGITLIAGFASTVGWPLTALGLESIGWRNTCFAWALGAYPDRPADQLLHAAGGEGSEGCRSGLGQTAYPDRPDHDPPGVHLCGGLDRHRRDGGAHAPDTRGRRSDHRAGGGGRRAVRPGASGCAHHRGEFSQPLSSAAVDPAGLPDAPDRRRHPRGRGRRRHQARSAIFFGLGNGILTIARGTLPLAIFGPKNYGYRLGLIGAPARMAQAAAPLVFGLLIDVMGSRVLIVSSALSLSALLALFLLRREPAAT